MTVTGARRHLLGQAALCYAEAGRPSDAARCRAEAGELVAAAELYERSGDPASAATCYHRAGRAADAVRCLLAAGRPEAAAACWEEAGDPLAAAWIAVLHARRPRHARGLLYGRTPSRVGPRLRWELAMALCDAAEGRPARLVTVLGRVAERFGDVTPAAEQRRVERWAVTAADEIGRPDLAALVFAAAYRNGLRGAVTRWRAWALTALGGTAGIPEPGAQR